VQPWERVALVAAGAGAGIAATFDTPICGVMFAIELMMPEVTARTVLPVALAAGTATFVANSWACAQPLFMIGPPPTLGLQPSPMIVFGLYVLLGAVIGVAAAAFACGLSAAEAAFRCIRNPYLRHVIGMLMLGVLMYTMAQLYGHYFIAGIGYTTIHALLADQLNPIAILPLLYVAKLAATSISIGSGASGGIITPALYMGATLGGTFGLVLNWILPMPSADVAVFAIVGMAAMVAGCTGASMTAIIMILELTRDYALVLPTILGVAMSVGVRHALLGENVNLLSPGRRGAKSAPCFSSLPTDRKTRR
jgi:chloride channel protein, CIC family